MSVALADGMKPMSRIVRQSGPTETTLFGEWLRRERTARGLTMEVLADLADTTQAMVSSLERGTRNPSRDMVSRLAGALSRDSDTAVASHLLNEGLRAAGFASEDEYDEHEVIDYLRGQPETNQDRALRILKAAFEEEDRRDNEGNIGKRAE